MNQKNQRNPRKGSSLFTSESVTCGHPDKVADQISDAILDKCLEVDSNARVACEVLLTKDLCVIAGEITVNGNVDYEGIARETVKNIGYVRPEDGFSYDTMEVRVHLHEQSPDISVGVNNEGAGDQGIMFGAACIEEHDGKIVHTNLMPITIDMARKITDQLSHMCNTGNFPIKPDGKSQVTAKYQRMGDVLEIDTIVVSVQHDISVSMDSLKEYIKKEVISPVLDYYGFRIEDVAHIYINPTGIFVLGGPAADVGLTGRKIIVDTYGGTFSHGGGAFSGKDPTKVDRSGAYMARYIAKNIVASGIADRVEVQLAYAIGVKKPISVNVQTFGTNKYPISLIAAAVYNFFDMTPRGIIRELHLKPDTGKDFKYRNLAADGHIGTSEKLPWEQTDKAEMVRKYVMENYKPKTDMEGKLKENSLRDIYKV